MGLLSTLTFHAEGRWGRGSQAGGIGGVLAPSVSCMDETSQDGVVQWKVPGSGASDSSCIIGLNKLI